MRRWALGGALAAVVAVGLWLALPSAKPHAELALPGTDEVTLAPRLRTELAAVAEEHRERGLKPRTRHVDAEGRPLYTNRLVHSASTYLRQHAHNPVNWFEWGDEAFELAEKLGRPVFLSVGYATCHWCHVMEEESFEDPEIAAYLNAHYIAIKVDREARPDVDRIYMNAVQAIHRRGGWPMSVWLKPDRKPFFAATYLPARDGDRGTRKGFLSFLTDIHETWTEHPDEIEGTAANLTRAVQTNMAPPPDAGLPPPDVAEALVRAAKDRYDTEHGGMKGRPKFPSNLPVRALLEAGVRGDEDAMDMARTTLDAMAFRGLFDQVGGGFHRYTVDERWDIPHFEKMLYDNARLARLYGEAFQLTKDLRYAAVVDETLTFMVRDLGAKGGGFASALDADSLGPNAEREEGRFYTWTAPELEAVLGDDASAFSAAFSVTPAGNFEGRNHLIFARSPTRDERARWSKAKLALQLERRRRPAPLRDEKVLTAWNGLAIDALAYNGWLFGREDWLDEARSTAERLLAGRVDGALTRLQTENGPEGTAFLDDYAFFIRGLITLFESTGNPHWLEQALALETQAQERFGDTRGAWFRAPVGHEALLVRDKPTSDQAIPSANTVMLDNELRLWALTGEDVYRDRADRIASGLPMERSPLAYPTAILAMAGRHGRLEEVVLVTQPGQRATDLKAAIRTAPSSWRVLIPVIAGDSHVASVVPSARGKVQLDGAPTAYVCRGGVCDRPTTDPQTLSELLTRRARSPSAPPRTTPGSPR